MGDGSRAHGVFFPAVNRYRLEGTRKDTSWGLSPQGTTAVWTSNQRSWRVRLCLGLAIGVCGAVIAMSKKRTVSFCSSACGVADIGGRS